MTEAEWLTCEEPWSMLVYLERGASERKLRLVAVAFCRRIWFCLTDERSRWAVVVGERFADGLAERDELLAADVGADAAREEGPVENRPAATAAWHVSSDTCYYFRNEGGPRIDNHHSGPSPEAVSSEAIYAVMCVRGEANGYTTQYEDEQVEKAAHVTLIRDIFGNPFRPVIFSPVWRTDTVIALARQMYESRDFSAMAILADALQDAGCDNTDILSHCRGSGPHVRGCWVVDLVLGKN